MNDERRVAAVTGASGGIGRAIAVRLAAEGAVVSLAARNETEGLKTVEMIAADGGTAVFSELDVTRYEDVARWIRDTHTQLGGLHWLVNNAGTNGRSARLEQYGIDEFENVIATNLLSAFYTAHTAIPLMREQGCGAIVNVGSTASLQGYGLLAGYTTSKHGLLGLTRSIALENADIPIRANCVCPGPIDTPLMSSIEQIVSPGDPAAARAMFEGTTALKRYGRPEEIAELVHFLLSDAAGYITGAPISIDGGVTTGV